MRTSVPAAALAALLLAGGAVGCSNDSGSDSSRNSDSVQTSEKSSNSTASASPSGTPAGAVAAAAEKSEEITSLAYTLNGRLPWQVGIDIEGAIRIKPDLAMSIRVENPEGATPASKIRLVDQTMYIGGGAETDTKKWMKLGPAGADTKEMNGLASEFPAGQNPLAVTATFLAHSDEVKKVGTKEIDGAETTHYAGTLGLDDLRTEAEQKDATSAEQVEQIIEMYKKLGIETLTTDAWIDGEDQVKQFRMRGKGTDGPLDLTLTFSDINEPVTVEAPPAENITGPVE